MKLKDVLMYVWQLPQNLCGLAWRSIKKDSIIATIYTLDSDAVGAEVCLMKAGGGVTLGKYIFISQTFTDQALTIKHECGHVRQSKILGPLYLIVIGIPSLIHAALNDYVGCCNNKVEGYYHFYTEHILMGPYDIRSIITNDTNTTNTTDNSDESNDSNESNTDGSNT